MFVVRHGGRIAGAAVAYPPSPKPPGLLSRILAGLGAATVGPTATMRYVAYEREIRKMRPQQPHWYLFFLGVTPSFHGQGIGTKFVRHICRLADADGVDCYLETSVPAQVRFYGEHGFELLEQRCMENLGGLKVSAMLRKPR